MAKKKAKSKAFKPKRESKKVEPLVIGYNLDDRIDFVQGFRKRKLEKKQRSQQQRNELLKEEKREIRREKNVC